ncbi:CoA-binding protein [Thalassoporum mexicanum]|uniref:CoA-binding protein n=1 Tax=Thalassoporum mexicanum TaxID=3457544 RepID=UPI00059EFB89|nr:CoA-binding protein [Pseudanabaena sp. PCC 7367]
MSMTPDDKKIQQILTEAKTIALVGYSPKPARPSYQIGRFLKQAGYKVYPVNPIIKEIDGEQCYRSLREVPKPIDIVNVFRRSEFLPEIIEQAIAINAKTIWAQLDIYDQAAAERAIAAGLNVIMDSCIKIEYLRLGIKKYSDR